MSLASNYRRQKSLVSLKISLCRKVNPEDAQRSKVCVNLCVDDTDFTLVRLCEIKTHRTALKWKSLIELQLNVLSVPPTCSMQNTT